MVFLAACSSQSSEGEPAKDAVGTTNAAPGTSTTVAADLIAAVDEGKAACVEYEQARAAYVNPGDDLFEQIEAMERTVKATERLEAAIEQIEAIDASVIPIEELQRWYDALQTQDKIDNLADFFLKFSEVFLLICDRISQYR
jgi:hypothetical protein